MNFVLLIFILVLLSPLLLFPLYGGWEGLITLLVTALTMVVLRYADYWMESAAFKKELRRRVKERYADTPWRQRPLLLEALLDETRICDEPRLSGAATKILKSAGEPD